MWEWLDEVSYDQSGTTEGGNSGYDYNTDYGSGSEGYYDGSTYPASDGGAFDMAGSNSYPDGSGSGTIFDGTQGVIDDLLGMLPPEWKDAAISGVKKYGLQWLQKQLGLSGNGPGGSSNGTEGMGWGEAALNASPLAFAYLLANRQRDDINPYIDRLNTLQSQYAGNQPAYLKSLTDPYDQQTGLQRSALMQSLGSRGVLGSSFGNMDIANLDYLRDTGRGNLLAGGINSGVDTQSKLVGQQIGAVNNRNLGTNLLLGAGLGAAGRMFQSSRNKKEPKDDLFGLSNLLGSWVSA